MRKLFINKVKSLVIAAVIFILSIASISVAAASEAVVLDFNSLPTGTFTERQEDGFNIRYIGYGDLQKISEVTAGNNVLKDSKQNSYGAEVIISSLDGGNFYFNSLDYNNFNNNSGSYRIDVTAIKYDGKATMVQLKPTSSNFSTLTSTALGVDGIVLRQIRVNLVSGNADYSVDNIKLQPVAPPSCTAPDDKTGIEATGVTTHVDLGFATSDDSNAKITSNAPVGMMFGVGRTTVTWTATNSAGSSTAQQIVEVVDTTKPVFTFVPADVTILSSGLTTKVDIGTVIATDIFTVNVTKDAPTAGFPVGDTIVTWTATDANGNKTTATQKVTVYQYTFGGILKPIKADGSSLFKAGSTVPVKFQLTDLGGKFVTDAVASISYAMYTGDVIGTDTEAVSTSAANTGAAFRYDSASNQYVFNLNTKGWAVGYYQLTIKLDDGFSYTAKISLK